MTAHTLSPSATPAPVIEQAIGDCDLALAFLAHLETLKGGDGKPPSGLDDAAAYFTKQLARPRKDAVKRSLQRMRDKGAISFDPPAMAGWAQLMLTGEAAAPDAAPSGAGHAHGDAHGDGTQLVPLSALHPSPLNPRKTFDEDALDELAGSILAEGLLQNLVARPRPDAAGQFEIVAGERRRRACQRLAEQGRSSPRFDPAAPLRVLVRPLSDFEMRMIAIAENARRADPHWLEQADAYAAAKRDREAEGGDPGKVAGEIAAALGLKSPRMVEQMIKASQTLCEAVRAAAIDESRGLKFAHARALSAGTDAEQAALLSRFVQGAEGYRTEADLARRLEEMRALSNPGGLFGEDETRTPDEGAPRGEAFWRAVFEDRRVMGEDVAAIKAAERLGADAQAGREAVETGIQWGALYRNAGPGQNWLYLSRADARRAEEAEPEETAASTGASRPEWWSAWSERAMWIHFLEDAGRKMGRAPLERKLAAEGVTNPGDAIDAGVKAGAIETNDHGWFWVPENDTGAADADPEHASRYHVCADRPASEPDPVEPNAHGVYPAQETVVLYGDEHGAGKWSIEVRLARCAPDGRWRTGYRYRRDQGEASGGVSGGHEGHETRADAIRAGARHALVYLHQRAHELPVRDARQAARAFNVIGNRVGGVLDYAKGLGPLDPGADPAPQEGEPASERRSPVPPTAMTDRQLLSALAGFVETGAIEIQLVPNGAPDTSPEAAAACMAGEVLLNRIRDIAERQSTDSGYARTTVEMTCPPADTDKPYRLHGRRGLSSAKAG
ncbi:ParB/RepB/Spo0J family partition protein [Marinicauda sp. Alg238-R41]|uniref:ParB/RepB/Spo0J family partition protein n=1 Tax=Marinicauda sp. Alg238-R41 TaxID=2993447 RepID=UPI0022E77F2E|nr:ParB/RepB/Spo0J family partition protein [Marinicauda sp. Alg238-R41]